MIISPWRRSRIKRIQRLPEGMRQRGEYLLKNPWQGRKTLAKINGIKIKSNCFGTTILLRGPKALQRCEEISRQFPTKPNELPIFYVPDPTRPGHIDRIVMEEFLKEYCQEVDQPEPGDVITSRSLDESKLVHSAVYAGYGIDTLEQPNTGKPFALIGASNIRGRYYNAFKEL